MPRQNRSNYLTEVDQLLAENGFEGMANAVQILLNETMKIKRNEYLGITFMNCGLEQPFSFRT